jgi:hypothetical protein
MTKLPQRVDAILAFGAAAVGAEPDSIGAIYCGASILNRDNAPLTILDWDVEQLSAGTLGRWVPSVFQRLEELAAETDCAITRARSLTIDPEGIGTIIYQQASALYPIDLLRNEGILAMDMPQRSVAASGYVYGELVELAPEARKTTKHKGKTRCHLTHQVAAFGVNQKPDAAGVLLVAFADAVLEIFSADAMQRRTTSIFGEPLPP